MAIITKDELKAYLGIPDTIDDPMLTVATNAANQWVEDYCGRDFDKTATTSATARTYQPSEGCWLWTDDFWETSVLAVKLDNDDDGTYEVTWVLDTDFILEPADGLIHGEARPYYKIRPLAGRILPTWGRRRQVQVTAAWGWAAVPNPVKHATLIQAGRLFHRKDSPQGVVGGFADFTAMRVSRQLDPDVTFELAPFRHPAIAVPMVA